MTVFIAAPSMRKRPKAPWSLERVTGIEPALSAWKAGVLPLNYTRLCRGYCTSFQMVGTTGFGPSRFHRAGCARATLPLRSRPNAPLARSPAPQVRIMRSVQTCNSPKVGKLPRMVGTTGFEPATSCSQSRRATKLRHVPTQLAKRYFSVMTSVMPASPPLLHKLAYPTDI